MKTLFTDAGEWVDRKTYITTHGENINLIEDLAEAKAALEEIMEWVENWNVPWEEDNEWINHTLPKIQKVLGHE